VEFGLRLIFGGSGFRVEVLRFRVDDLGFRVQGFEF
jgi:hypothetical protein